MPTGIAINGFGRTGRQAFKAIWQGHRDVLDVRAIGVRDPDLAPATAHLLKYDSNYGRYDRAVGVRDGYLIVDEHPIRLVSAQQPAQLPWRELGVELVIEASGVFVAGRQAAGHLEAGAEKVIVSAPSDGADFTLILGVSHHAYQPARHHVISTGSDTTNALAPVLHVLDQAFGVVDAQFTAVHAYTNEQKLLDRTDPDLRRARAAAVSIVPTTTRAHEAIAAVLPRLRDRVKGHAVRVPVATVSILEVTAHLERTASAEDVNSRFEEAAAERLKGILNVSRMPLVSTDYKGSPYSAVIDAPLTITRGPLVKVSAWYDNEFGYSSRVADVAAHVCALGLNGR